MKKIEVNEKIATEIVDLVTFTEENFIFCAVCSGNFFYPQGKSTKLGKLAFLNIEI